MDQHAWPSLGLSLGQKEEVNPAPNLKQEQAGRIFNTLSSDVEIDIAESWYFEQRGIALHREGDCHPSYITSH